MGFYCVPHQRTFATLSGFQSHNRSHHKHPRPSSPRSTFSHHNLLDAKPCDVDGDILPLNTPPPPLDNIADWSPFEDRPAFEMAEWAFEKVETSGPDFTQLMKILTAKQVVQGQGKDSGFYRHSDDLLKTIDAIEVGDAPWESFTIRYTGPLPLDAPQWKREGYTVYTRNTLTVARNMLKSPDFKNSFDYTPFQEYIGVNERRWSNFMSGHWAWKQADIIAADPDTHHSMFCPVILGADKTTASVATGHTQFHPLYMSIGNVSNEMRRAHREAVMPTVFLAIPKASTAHKDDDEFRVFCKQLYHNSLTRILWPLRHGMTTPHVMQCPDGHYRRTIFGLGPFIADYPEQVLLAGIVQGWCPK
ncbi:hypothetical protein EUX98_g4659 [Antrodiella citrinella]|uniref:C2H2-type domain-containing protein n=1 Tax=Antrodiella citrinella TaxID=2447956 RepID=A0A4S4MTM3_9APHY|nr:hypothetical protein EUX98_g4659 [Antrodiella citrinella]